ncbi:MAG: response regulator [Elusimicrobia bacterium]|nr:response regulator [Elusimicrobiota bacterium]
MKRKILITDDEPSVQRVLARLVKMLDCEAALASDGAEAVALAAELKPDIVIMDLHMPGLDGLEALREILERSPKARILVVTGDALEMRAQAAIESGAVDFIAKPFDFEDMRRTLELHLLAH